MKKIEFKEGAITPFWTKDLEYMQNGIEEVLKGICDGFGQQGRHSFLISGCGIYYNGGNISMRPGWFYYFGEILPVKELESTPCDNPDQKIYFIKKTGYDSSGKRNVILDDSTLLKDIYRVDYLEPTLEKTNGLAISQGAWNLSERILQRSVQQSRLKDTGLKEAILARLEGLNIQNTTVKYRRIGGVVQLYGGFFATSDKYISGVIASGLPNPVEEVVVNRGDCIINIKTTGDMLVQNLQGVVPIGGILYLTDPVYNTTVTNDGHYL